MAYSSHHKSTKYNINENMKSQVSYKRYTRKDFIDGMKRYEIVGKAWTGISENTAKKSYIKSLICAMAAGLHKELINDLRDQYISDCNLLKDSKEILYINYLIEKYVKDDIDLLTNMFGDVKIDPVISKAFREVNNESYKNINFLKNK